MDLTNLLDGKQHAVRIRERAKQEVVRAEREKHQRLQQEAAEVGERLAQLRRQGPG